MDDRVEPSATPPPRRFGRPLALFLILLVSLAAGGIYMSTAVIDHVDNLVAPGQELGLPKPLARVLPGLEATPSDGAPGNKRINILVLGIDKRPHHTVERDGPPNTDSMHLISIDPVSKTATALTIPRDLYVEMPNPAKQGEFIETRINQAYRLGIEAKYPGGGAVFAKRVVEETFRIPIDHYAVVDWLAFADVIDALGGVWITVPERMADVEGFNPWDGNAFEITIPAGTQYMDAITALAYARYRSDEESDFGRIYRQQEVMRAAADEALRRGWLTQAKPLYDRFKGAVDSDLTATRLLGLAPLAKSIGMDRVKTVSLAGERHEAVTGVITPRGEDVLVPQWDVLGRLIRESIDDPALKREGATVSVANASGVRGQDVRTVAYLRRFLIPPERITAADGPTNGAAVPSPTPGALSASASGGAAATETTITYTGDANETATRIATWLNLPSSRVTRLDLGPGAPAAVTVLVGRDVRLPNDEQFQRFRLR